jgi:hypothetical protein
MGSEWTDFIRLASSLEEYPLPNLDNFASQVSITGGVTSSISVFIRLSREKPRSCDGPAIGAQRPVLRFILLNTGARSAGHKVRSKPNSKIRIICVKIEITLPDALLILYLSVNVDIVICKINYMAGSWSG